PHLTQSIVDILRTQSERLQNLTQELATVRESLEERKLIERAKGVLMMKQGLNEEAAYRLLRKHAMNQNRRIAEVAQAILS
ncbi:ANTAR domain-containing response regulator, partial [Salmonella enterica]